MSLDLDETGGRRMALDLDETKSSLDRITFLEVVEGSGFYAGSGCLSEQLSQRGLGGETENNRGCSGTLRAPSRLGSLELEPRPIAGQALDTIPRQTSRITFFEGTAHVTNQEARWLV